MGRSGDAGKDAGDALEYELTRPDAPRHGRSTTTLKVAWVFGLLFLVSSITYGFIRYWGVGP